MQRLLLFGGKGPSAYFSVVQPKPFFLSILLCPLRLGRGLLCDNPLHPRTPRACSPWNPLGSSGRGHGLVLPELSPPLRSGEDLLQGFGSPLGGCAACGVFLRAMPRPAELSRCELRRQPSAYGSHSPPSTRKFLYLPITNDTVTFSCPLQISSPIDFVESIKRQVAGTPKLHFPARTKRHSGRARREPPDRAQRRRRLRQS